MSCRYPSVFLLVPSLIAKAPVLQYLRPEKNGRRSRNYTCQQRFLIIRQVFLTFPGRYATIISISHAGSS